MPSAIANDWYEVTDPLVFMGIPTVVVGTSVGALVGTRRRAPASAEPPPRRLWWAVPVVAATGLTVWLALWATGALGIPPPGIG